MKSFRAIIVLLVGLAVAIAPVGAAWASIKVNAAVAQPAIAAVVGDNAGATADMSDCDKMMGGSGEHAKAGGGKGDCPCCDDKSACPPEFCVYKCFKVFSGIGRDSIAPLLTSLQFQPDKPDRPPDWIATPQLPPPRA